MNSQCKCDLDAHNHKTLDCFNEHSLFETEHLFTAGPLFNEEKVKTERKPRCFYLKQALLQNP